MCQGGDSGIRVRIKAGYFAGREGTLVEGEVRLESGWLTYFDVAYLEFLPEPARDVTAILAGVGRWQQQDPSSRSVHFVGEPVVAGNIRGHVVTIHVVTIPDDPNRHGLDTRSLTVATPASAAEVVEALDRLASQTPGTKARVTTPDAEALATHADRTPAYYGPAEGIS